MQNEELLYSFFDDGLDEATEELLFREIAADPELRRQFLGHLRLHSMIQKDAASINTPADVREQLFVGLGLSAPQSLPLHITHSLRRIVTAFFESRLFQYGGYVAAVFITAGLTVFLFWYYGNSVSVESFSNVRGSGRLMSTSSTVDMVQNRKPAQRDNERNEHQQMKSDFSEADIVSEPESVTLHAGIGYLPKTSQNLFTNTYQKDKKTGKKNDGYAVSDTDIQDNVLNPQNVRSANQPTSMLRDRTKSADRPAAIVQNTIVISLHGTHEEGSVLMTPDLVFKLPRQFGKLWTTVDDPGTLNMLSGNMIRCSPLNKITDYHAVGFKYAREDFSP